MKRSTKKLWVYIGISVGTVALAFLCVLASTLLYEASENALYGQHRYEVANIISSDGLGSPLSLKTRLSLFNLCQVEGDKRLPLPDEVDEKTVTEKALMLWNEALMAHSDEQGVMPSGDYASDLMGRVKVTATLRDFFNTDTSAKIALWCVQVYCDSGMEDATYCLSIQFDSRTADPYTMSCALFSNILPSNNRVGFVSFCNALGVSDVDESGASIDWQEEGAYLRLTLPSGLVVQKTCRYGQEYSFKIILED